MEGVFAVNCPTLMPRRCRSSPAKWSRPQLEVRLDRDGSLADSANPVSAFF